MGTKLYIVMYHYTRDLEFSRYPGIKGMEYVQFEKQLQFFKNNFEIVTMEQVLDAVEGKIFLPEKALLLTFDDGYIDNFTVAFPLLKKYGLQGSFFIPGKTFVEHKLLDVNKIHFILATANIVDIKAELFHLLDKNRKDGRYPLNKELYKDYGIATRLDGADVVFCKRILQTGIPEDIRKEISSELFDKFVGVAEEVFARELYMNIDQLRCLKSNGMFIGIHGYDHFWLGNLEEDLMKRDIDKALSVMREFIDPNRWVMNYPYGSFNDKVKNYIVSRGAVLALTTEVRPADILLDNPYEIPRIDCIDFPPRSGNYLNFA